ncbi:MAG: NAD(P)H-hydrate epimerase [Leucobacter sp.]
MSEIAQPIDPRNGYGADQVREAERPLLERGEPLMLRAAAALAEKIAAAVPPGSGVLLLVGSGDNGGDALHAGAMLAERGFTVRAVLLGSRAHAEGLARALAAGASEIPVDRVLEVASDSAAVVDGILGIGASGALRGAAREAVEALLPLARRPRIADGAAVTNSAESAVLDRPLFVAVDLPSGLDPDTGETSDGTVLPADLTVTFGAVKAGLLRTASAPLVGRLVLVDIGLGPELSGVRPLYARDASPPAR